MLDLEYWLLNDVIWHKTNPMPNFRGTRFTNATETLLWAKKSEAQKKYTFNYHAMKNLNDEKQMQNVWHLPLCTGPERIKINGKKAHSTQKPEALLYRVILSSSHPGDIILDPFFGSGTTGAVAKKLQRNFVGIEQEADYIALAEERLAEIEAVPLAQEVLVTKSKRNLPRVHFGKLIEREYLKPGQKVYSKKRDCEAVIKADSQLVWHSKSDPRQPHPESGSHPENGSHPESGSIHKIATLAGKSANNGWDFWHYEDERGQLVCIDKLRERYRQEHNLV